MSAVVGSFRVVPPKTATQPHAPHHAADAPERGGTVVRQGSRPRLTHVDAMRPVKQLGVVATHSLQTFAPAANIGAGACLMISHVTRFAFMFISSAMLVYAYPAVRRGGWRPFWRRRLVTVALPYVTWTVIYFGLGLGQAGRLGSFAADSEHLASLLLTGYDHLYFLLLLLQFYLIYPALLWVIRRTERHHWQLLGVSLAVEFALSWLVHGQHVPDWMLGKAATRELWNYQLFVIAGGLMAWHYHDVHGWLCRHWRALLAATALALAFGEASYALAAAGVAGFRAADPSDPFQPAEIPLYLGLITMVYLLGVLMSSQRRPRWLLTVVQAGANYSYGIYLSQVLLLTALTTLGWQSLDRYLPWEVVTAGGILIVFTASALLTALLARLPAARATAGIPRRPWRAASGGSSGDR